MIDGKMVGILQGDTGSSKCHYCACTVEEMNNVVQIIKGFDITKDYDSCCKAWKKLDEGEIDWTNPEREGQCHRPLVAVSNFYILHWKLRCFDFALGILYRLICGVYVWGKVGIKMEKDIASAKKKAQEHIREKIGILVDVPTAGGGNTNSGVLAQRFFYPKSRDAICELIKNDDDRENYRTLLRDLNVMLTVCLGTKKLLRTAKLWQLGKDIMSHIRTAFLNSEGLPWIPMNPSLHTMCAHSWQLFEMCTNVPLSAYSEQAQEHWNKCLRSFKSGSSARARQHSLKDNIKDVMARMLQMTHPVVVAKRRQIKCTICGQVGHTSRSELFHSISQFSLGEDDKLINAIYE